MLAQLTSRHWSAVVLTRCEVCGDVRAGVRDERSRNRLSHEIDTTGARSR